MILVVGPGRCGTSTTARFVHNLGVNMGEEFVPADKGNPEGYFEDIEFRDLNNAVLRNKITLKQWREDVTRVISYRVEPWGFKDPKIANLIKEYRGLLPDAKFIRCHRNQDSILLSLQRVYKFDREKALRMLVWRERLLDEGLLCAPVININVTDGSEWQANVKEFCNVGCYSYQGQGISASK